jgi:hypothetical protein
MMKGVMMKESSNTNVASLDTVADSLKDTIAVVFPNLSKSDIEYSLYKKEASTKPDSTDTVDCIELVIKNQKLVEAELGKDSCIYVEVTLGKKNTPEKFKACTEVTDKQSEQKLTCTVNAKHCIESEMVEALKSVMKYSKKILSDSEFKNNTLNTKNSAYNKGNGKEKDTFDYTVVA